MIIVNLELENDQEGNTWWSNGHPEGPSSIQVHVDRPVYVALGEPRVIKVTIEVAA